MLVSACLCTQDNSINSIDNGAPYGISGIQSRLDISKANCTISLVQIVGTNEVEMELNGGSSLKGLLAYQKERILLLIIGYIFGRYGMHCITGLSCCWRHSGCRREERERSTDITGFRLLEAQKGAISQRKQRYLAHPNNL